MKRKLYNKLLNWKQEQNGKSAILLNGARRVGKSYLAKQFAENEYKSHIIIDFNDHTYKVTDDMSIVDPKALAMRARYIYLFIERLTR